MVSCGFATEGVCARGGGLMLRKQITKSVKRAEHTKPGPKGFQKGPLSCRQENRLWT